MPSTCPPRSRISRAITSTSLIRGTLVRTHSSTVNRQAASSGSAEFLFPSTSTALDRRWPPSINSVDINSRSSLRACSHFSDTLLVEGAEIDDLLAQLDAEAVADGGPALIDQAPDGGSRRVPFVHNEVAVRRRDAGARERGALHARPIDERAGRPGETVRHGVAARVRILKDAPRAGRVERLRPLAKGERGARDGAKRGGLARRDAEH